MSKRLDWKPDTNFASGKGATVQHFEATDDGKTLTIETSAWGDGELRLNGTPRARVVNEPTESRAFRDLEAIAEEIDEMGQTSASVACAGDGMKKMLNLD